MSLKLYERDLSEISVLFATSTGGDMLHIYEELKKGLKRVEIVRNKKSDPNDKSSFYKVPLVEYDDKKKFLIDKSKYFDIIHISYHWKVVKWIRDNYPNKKIVYHLRGSEIRNNKKLVNEACKISDVILYSTEDLINFIDFENRNKSFYMYRAIDTKHFHKREINSSRKVCFWKGNLSFYKNYFKNIPDMEYVERNTVPYKDLPSFLSNYKEFYNIRFDKNGDIIKGIKEGSKLMLEALSLGLICYTWDMKRVENLPEEYHYKNVSESIKNVYKSLL